MSDAGNEHTPKRPPDAAAGDDPWAKWRQPEATAASPAPAPAPREASGPGAVDGEKAAEKATPAAPRPRPTGTLSPLKPAAPPRAAAKKPWKSPSTAAGGKSPRGASDGKSPWATSGGKPAHAAPGAPRVRDQVRGGKVRDGYLPPGERPPAAPPPVRDPANTQAGVRLSKVMSERAMCSRREADLWIERGWVFVDGVQVSELGSRIDPDAEITISKEAVKDQAKQVTILLNKPVGYVSGQPEADCKPAVTLISAESWVRQSGDPEFKPWMLRGLAPAGRLDIDSTGLLVFTQDGRVAKKLIGDDSQVEKEYLVRVSGEMIPDGLKLLQHGLALDGKPLRPAWVKQLNEDQLHFILKEGKKRQIRRMCELVGLRVTGLKRVRIGKVRLGDLPLGQWRFLRADESF
jgi:23S rRNA pseudouridine2604 synthase